MSKYSFEFVDGHIIFDADGLSILLDTGAPDSVGDSDSLNFEKRSFTLEDNYNGVTTSSLSEVLGTPVDVLMGIDIISCFDILIDPREMCIEFSAEYLELDGVVLLLENFMNIPILKVPVNGTVTKMFFDTGAKLSYIQPDVVANIEPGGQIEDFYPGIGCFNTETYDLNTIIGDMTVKLKYGILPELLQASLMITGVRGIIGTQIFRYFTGVLSLRRDKLILVKVPENSDRK